MRWMLILTMLATLALAPAAGADDFRSRWVDRTPAHVTHPDHPGVRIVVVPTPVYVVPQQCLAPGYRSYSWVPQVSVSSLWVPGAWSPDGYWIESHYEQQVSSGGYWQPYWVETHWGAC